ncbi:MAG: hypothetical protein ACXAC5_05305 [Promethearchaeota archaeon]|jgi:hypothetical protein
MNELKVEDIVNRLSNCDDDDWYRGGYEELIEATGCEIIDSLKMGSYQGDLLMIVSKNYRFGVLSTGYGSCAGCDELQGCYTHNDRAELAKKIYGKIIWKEPTKIIDYLQDKDWETEYYGKQKGLPEFVDKVKEQIIIRYLARI